MTCWESRSQTATTTHRDRITVHCRFKLVVSPRSGTGVVWRAQAAVCSRGQKWRTLCSGRSAQFHPPLLGEPGSGKSVELLARRNKLGSIIF